MAVTDDDSRARLLLARAEDARDRGELDAAREAASELVALARRLGSAELLARAGLSQVPRYLAVEVGTVDRDLVALLQDALAGLPEDALALRSKVTATMANQQLFVAPAERRIELTATALAVARESGDADALALALYSHHLNLYGTADTAGRLAIGIEHLALSAASGDAEAEAVARMSCLVDHLQLGEIDAVDADIAAYADLVSRSNNPTDRWLLATVRAMRAIIDGSLVGAEPLLFDAFAEGRECQPQNAATIFFVQLFSSRVFQGRAGELEDQMRAYVELYPEVASARCALAYLYCELGKDDQARREYELLAGRGFVDIPRDLNWTFGIARAALVCTHLGDRPRADLLYDMLVAYEGQTVVVGAAAVCNGAVSWYLARLAVLAGRDHDAKRHFASAVATHRNMNARPFLAYSLLDRARHLYDRGAKSERALARALALEAQDVATSVGMPGTAEAAGALVASR